MNISMETDMDCLENLEESQRKAFLKAFVCLASMDGKLDKEECEFIRSIAKVYGFSEKNTTEILAKQDKKEVIKEVSKITNRRAALELIKEMCILAHADDVLSDSELMYIGEVGQAMNIELEKIEQISNWVIDRIIWLEEAKLIFEEV